MKSQSVIKPGFCTVFTHSRGKVLGYVSQVKRTTGNIIFASFSSKLLLLILIAVHFADGWEFEMQTGRVEKKPIESKCLQVEFVTNIQPLLEFYVSLYELRKSSLQDVFLHPSSQYEDVNSSINTNFAENDTVCLIFFCIPIDFEYCTMLNPNRSQFREFYSLVSGNSR